MLFEILWDQSYQQLETEEIEKLDAGVGQAETRCKPAPPTDSSVWQLLILKSGTCRGRHFVAREVRLPPQTLVENSPTISW